MSTEVTPEAAHTPLPWRLSEGDGWISVGPQDGHEALIFDTLDGRPVEERRANVLFTVRAANNHAALLAACKRAARQLRERLIVASPWGGDLVAELETAITDAEAP